MYPSLCMHPCARIHTPTHTYITVVILFYNVLYMICYTLSSMLLIILPDIVHPAQARYGVCHQCWWRKYNCSQSCMSWGRDVRLESYLQSGPPIRRPPPGERQQAIIPGECNIFVRPYRTHIVLARYRPPKRDRTHRRTRVDTFLPTDTRE